jgi:hypothetical protein
MRFRGPEAHLNSDEVLLPGIERQQGLGGQVLFRPTPLSLEEGVICHSDSSQQYAVLNAAAGETKLQAGAANCNSVTTRVVGAISQKWHSPFG